MITLEPDQARLVNGVRESMRNGNRWVLMQSPTGSGKTFCGAEIIHGTINKGTRCMITVPRKELLRQTAMALREFDIPFTYIAGGHETDPHAQTFLATTQTLRERIKNGVAPDADLIMIDEGHFGGNEVDGIITHYKSRGARGIGMSATPLLLSGQGMNCWYDDMVQGETIEWLIQNGRLSDYRMFRPESEDIQRATKGKRKLVGDEVQHYRQHAMGKLAIAYCESIAHSKQMADRFNAAGIPAANIDGYMKDDDRRRIITAFARREILVLCNNMLLTFGFDLKSASGIDVTIEAMIDSAYTESLALQMQKWGRVLRKKPFPALIFDHAGNRYTHGFPDDHRDWTLKGDNIKFGSGGSAGAIQNCIGGYLTAELTGEKMPACYMSHRPAPRCPNCGAWYKPDVKIIQSINGELSEQNREPRRAFTMDETQRLREDIDELTKNGVKKGMPVAAARKWAITKATQNLEERIDREKKPGLQVSMFMGDREIAL
jgi:DNA repair protein RadD